MKTEILDLVPEDIREQLGHVIQTLKLTHVFTGVF